MYRTFYVLFSFVSFDLITGLHTKKYSCYKENQTRIKQHMRTQDGSCREPDS